MKRLFPVIGVLFFLVLGCSKSKPKGILSDKKMSDLMTEVYIVDSYLNNLPIDSGRKVMPVLYQQLFDKFKIDSTVFLENLNYYYGNPIELEKVNAKVKDAIGQYEKDALRVDSIEQAHTRDSVNRVLKLQEWADEMKRLILDVHLDSTAYSFAVHNSAFFQRAGITVQRHELLKPEPVEAAGTDEASEEAVREEEGEEQADEAVRVVDSMRSTVPLDEEIIERRIETKGVKRRPFVNELRQKSKL